MANGRRARRFARARESVSARPRRPSRPVHHPPARPQRTLILRPGDTVVVGGAGQRRAAAAAPVPPERPRLRSGLALKRLANGDAVLKDLLTDRFLKLDAADVGLLVLLDGRRTLERLALEAESVAVPDGPGRLALLLADLADRGLVSGVAGSEPEGLSRLARLMRPRSRTVEATGMTLERLYGIGAWLLFTRTALAALALIATVGMGAFATALVSGEHTPFVVGGHVTVGSAVFLAGRFLVAGVHELAHGLTMTSFGRTVRRAGIKLVLVFPYMFVDTSDAWFEDRRRRMTIAVAGPFSDLTIAGGCGIVALFGAGVAADAAFQFASGAYLGALYNLNPLLERDGYHLLADALRQPALRTRARRHLAARIAGRAQPDRHSGVLTVYAVAAFGWTLVAAGLMVTAASQHFRGALEAHITGGAVWALLAPVYVVALLPAAIVVTGPLLARRRRG